VVAAVRWPTVDIDVSVDVKDRDVQEDGAGERG